MKRRSHFLFFILPLISISAVGQTLGSGQSLAINVPIKSPSGVYSIILQQDGNVVLYKNGSTALWSSKTAGKSNSKAVMQTDGNFVITDSGGHVTWSSKTNGKKGASLTIQDDGNAVIYAPAARWATNTTQSDDGPAPETVVLPSIIGPLKTIYMGDYALSGNGKYRLVMQNDGNLVLYEQYGTPSQKALWGSGTVNKGASAALQPEGTLVVFNASGQRVWTTPTAGYNILPTLNIQDDGNLVTYSGISAWSTSTGPTPPANPSGNSGPNKKPMVPVTPPGLFPNIEPDTGSYLWPECGVDVLC